MVHICSILDKSLPLFKLNFISIFIKEIRCLNMPTDAFLAVAFHFNVNDDYNQLINLYTPLWKGCIGLFLYSSGNFSHLENIRSEVVLFILLLKYLNV